MILRVLDGKRPSVVGSPQASRAFPTLMNLHQGSVAKVFTRESLEEKADPEEAVVEEVALPYFINTKRLEAGEELRFYKEEIAKEKKSAAATPITTSILRKKARFFE